MIECYNEYTYSYWTMVCAMILFFGPPVILTVGFLFAEIVRWIIKKIKGDK